MFGHGAGAVKSGGIPRPGQAGPVAPADGTGVALPLTQRLRRAAVAGLALLVLTPAIADAARRDPPTSTPRNRACAYTKHSHATLKTFQRMVGHTFSCAVVFNDAAPDWRGWERPWFIHHGDKNLNWGKWATAPGTSRRLVISQSLTADSVLRTDWRRDGARGRYDSHFLNLARNLVAAGLGGSVIRLAHEANYEGSKNPVGTTAAQRLAWRKFWARAVRTMRRVPGAHFSFDWTVNAYWQPIPLATIYPGDDVVDIVGVDAYDAGVRQATGRWHVVATRTNGVNAVARFARSHRKLLSIPEWGLMPRGARWQGGGDDPGYVDGIARTLRTNRIAYQAYFYAGDTALQLRRSPKSLARLRALLR